jgi:hypothetical protein
LHPILCPALIGVREIFQPNESCIARRTLRRYSPPPCVGAIKGRVKDQPDPAHIGTSFAERQNLNIRMHTRRFTRLTNAFSKKVENHARAVALFAMHHNFVRIRY